MTAAMTLLPALPSPDDGQDGGGADERLLSSSGCSSVSS